MPRIFRVAIALSLTMACAIPVLAADATVDQVYAAARAGHLAQAQQMMTDVLRDHPQSAKAHYVAAELYARAGDAATAKQELNTAQRLDPGLPFARTESVDALQRQLARGRVAGVGSEDAALRAPFPLRTLILVIGAVAVLWLIFRRRAVPANAYAQYPGAVPAGPGVGPMYGGPGMGGGMGSGIAGGLASGLAVGAGVVAGEELAHHFLDRPGAALPSETQPPVENGNLDRNDFGVSDASSWDDKGADADAGGDFGGGGGDWN